MWLPCRRGRVKRSNRFIDMVIIHLLQVKVKTRSGIRLTALPIQTILRTMKSILQKLRGVLSKNVSIADYRKYLSEKYGKLGTQDYLEKRAKRATKTKFKKAMEKVEKVPPPEYDRR